MTESMEKLWGCS